MKKVYVAGPYSADNVLDVLRNIGRGQKICADLFLSGFAPFCPWHDRSYVMDYPHADFNVKQFQKHSMAWLEVSDAVFLIDGWQKSAGTLAEVKRAEELGIPVFDSFFDLIEWGGKDERNQ